MNEPQNWTLAGLLLLGAFHGLNPGMGWLFAVALGMQEQRRAAVWRSLGPLALGHALAVAAAIGVALLLGKIVEPGQLRWPVALILLGLGVYRLFRHCRSPRTGMRVSMGGLTLWSFLMATAHGAGLMVLPLFLGMSAVHADAPACHAAAQSPDVASSLLATLVHTLGYLGMTAGLAVVVYEKLGLSLLRRAWINLDLVWAVSLMLTGALSLLW